MTEHVGKKGYFWNHSKTEWFMGYLDHYNPVVAPHFTDENGRGWMLFQSIDKGPPEHLREELDLNNESNDTSN